MESRCRFLQEVYLVASAGISLLLPNLYHSLATASLKPELEGSCLTPSFGRDSVSSSPYYLFSKHQAQGSHTPLVSIQPCGF